MCPPASSIYQALNKVYSNPKTMNTELEKYIHSTSSYFEEKYGGAPALVAYAPGRINIIGEHTDYNLGLSMPAAINRWVIVCLRPRPDQTISVTSQNYHDKMEYTLGQAFTPDGSLLRRHWAA